VVKTVFQLGCIPILHMHEVGQVPGVQHQFMQNGYCAGLIVVLS
jgi:hypothetical protein